MKYRSEYGAGEVTAPQRLAELACGRQAAARGESLPQRFWTLAGWKKPFAAQARAANALLKLYDARAVLAAWEANPGVRSLAAPFFVPEVERAQARLDVTLKRADAAAPTETGDASAPPRPGVARAGGVRGKLKGL